MKLAVISDMHGNDVAFESVLDDIDRLGYDRIVCLGDAIQSGPQPAEVVQRLRDRQIPVVMGNADAWLLTGVKTADEGVPDVKWQKMEEVREWSYGKLSADDKAFIGGFAPTLDIDLGGSSILCFHGSPKSFDDLLFPDTSLDRFQELLPLGGPTYFAGGHTHIQFVRQLGQGFHFNPGSVGAAVRYDQPQDTRRSDPFAEYAMLEVSGENVSLTFKRIPFDVKRLASVYSASDRPYAGEAIAKLIVS